jgi:hypothetical protein
MKAKKWMFVLSALLLLSLLTSFSPAQEDALPYVPGQLLVKFKTGLLRFHAIPASQRQLNVTWGLLPIVTPAVILSTGVTPTVPPGGS